MDGENLKKKTTAGEAKANEAQLPPPFASPTDPRHALLHITPPFFLASFSFPHCLSHRCIHHRARPWLSRVSPFCFLWRAEGPPRWRERENLFVCRFPPSPSQYRATSYSNPQQKIESRAGRVKLGAGGGTAAR